MSGSLRKANSEESGDTPDFEYLTDPAAEKTEYYNDQGIVAGVRIKLRSGKTLEYGICPQ